MNYGVLSTVNQILQSKISNVESTDNDNQITLIMIC